MSVEVDIIPAGAPPDNVPSLAFTIRSKTTNYTALVNDFIEVDATSADVTITLPSAPAAGSWVGVKKVDSSSHTVTVVGQGGALIEGDANATIITQYTGAIVLFDGTNWTIFAFTGGGVTGAGAVLSDDAYDATGWNNVTDIAPSKNAVRDKIEALIAAIAAAYQPLHADLTDLVARWVAASASGPASLDFLEDSDNGTNKATVTAPAALAADVVITLPSATGTLVNTDQVFAQAQAVNAQTGTTYTLVAGDAGKLVTLSNGSAITLTVPQDSDATIAVGTYVDLYQLGAGQVTVAAGTGATLRTSGLTAKARAQYSRFGVQKVSANTWSLFGDLAAS